MDITLLVVSIVLTLLLAYALHVLRQVAKQRDALSNKLDAAMLTEARLRKAATDIYPYVAQTSVDMFYGELTGKQTSFTQRQEISAKVHHQNTVVRGFEEVFGIGHEAKAQAAMLAVSPDLAALDINGPQALDLMAEFQNKERNQ